MGEVDDEDTDDVDESLVDHHPPQCRFQLVCDNIEGIWLKKNTHT